MGTRQSGASASQRMKSTRGLFIGLFIAAVVVAGVLSFYASSSPDGLERVAADKGLNAKERDHSVKDSPLTHYSIKGVSNERVSVGLAGIIGVVAIAVVGAGFFTLVSSRSSARDNDRRATDIGT